MGIFVDGARSRRYLPTAKKALRILKTLPDAIQQKVGMRNGFLFKVKRNGQGWIKAPFGIYVALSDEKGLRQFVCDSAGSPAMPWFDKDEKDRYLLLPDPLPSGSSLQGVGVSTSVGDINSTSVSEMQMLLAKPANLNRPKPLSQWQSAHPVCMPLGGELVAVTYCYLRTSSHWVSATQLTHCYNHGKNDVDKANDSAVKLPSMSRTFPVGSGLGTMFEPFNRTALKVSSGYIHAIDWKSRYMTLSPTAEKYQQVLLYTLLNARSNTMYASELTLKDMYVGASTNFKNKLLAGSIVCRQLAAHYIAVGNNIKGVCVLYAPLYALCPGDDDPLHVGHYTSATTDHVAPEDRKWVITLSLVDFVGSIQTYTYNDMKGTLYELVAGELKWVVSAYMLRAGLTYAQGRKFCLSDTSEGILLSDGETPNPAWGDLFGNLTIWVSGEPYGKGRHVLYGAESYYCAVDTTGTVSPDEATSTWKLIRWVGKLEPGVGYTAGDAVGVEQAFDPDDPEETDPGQWVARFTLGALFGWPTDQGDYDTYERDTVTFADSNGVVYSWLRSCAPGAAQRAWGLLHTGARNGGFKFGAGGGVARTAIAVPQTVLADTNLRPKIALMTDTKYSCLADKADGTIAHLYVGSPFDAWENIPLPAGATMYTIRVTIPGDTADKCGFIGIGKKDSKYYIFFKPPGTDWVKLSPIPVGAENDADGVVDLLAAWDVCVFGDDAIVKKMMEVKQHPTARSARSPEAR